MVRIHIDVPDQYIFTTDIPVRITDINYGNHVGNDSLLSILHEARVRFLNSLNYTELNIEGCGIILADVAIQYKSQGLYGDILTIQIAAGDFSRAGFDLLYKVACNSRLVAVAKTGIVFFDYEKKKVCELPQLFLNKIKNKSS